MRAIVLLYTLASFIALVPLSVVSAAESESGEEITDTKLIKDTKGTWKLIETQCTLCHSTQLISQHRLGADQWLKSIRRMQSDEGLWDLGDDEAPILEYLTANYGGDANQRSARERRKPLNQQPLEEVLPAPTDDTVEDSKNSNTEAAEQ